MEELMKHFTEMYPDMMQLDKMDEFERVKEVGKVELLREMAVFIEEEYGVKPSK